MACFSFVINPLPAHRPPIETWETEVVYIRFLSSALLSSKVP